VIVARVRNVGAARDHASREVLEHCGWSLGCVGIDQFVYKGRLEIVIMTGVTR
jgi:hypothetical protein